MTRASMSLIAALSAVLFFLHLAPAFAQSPAATTAFDGRVLERETTIVGTTCSNSAVGIVYDLPGGMQSEDPATLRIVSSRGELARTRIGPEANYILWGAGERRSMAKLCGATSDRGNVLVIAIPQSAFPALGADSVEALVLQLGQAVGIRGQKPATQTIAGRTFKNLQSHGESNAGGKHQELFVAIYATEMDSYALVWQFSAHEPNQLTSMLDSLDSLKLSPSVTASATGDSRVALKRQAIRSDFQARMSRFLTAWLTERDQARTLSFIAAGAYNMPAIIGTYCDGWYKKGMSTSQTEKVIAENLAGVPADVPKGTGTQDIFKAWDRLPPEWIEASLNDVTKDHFLVASLDRGSLNRLFPGEFAQSDYEKFLEKQAKAAGNLYWIVFPQLQTDGDVFVIFTLWQELHGTWSIIHIDAVCQ